MFIKEYFLSSEVLRSRFLYTHMAKEKTNPISAKENKWKIRDGDDLILASPDLPGDSVEDVDVDLDALILNGIGSKNGLVPESQVLVVTEQLPLSQLQ